MSGTLAPFRSLATHSWRVAASRTRCRATSFSPFQNSRGIEKPASAKQLRVQNRLPLPTVHQGDQRMSRPVIDRPSSRRDGTSAPLLDIFDTASGATRRPPFDGSPRSRCASSLTPGRPPTAPFGCYNWSRLDRFFNSSLCMQSVHGKMPLAAKASQPKRSEPCNPYMNIAVDPKGAIVGPTVH